MRKINFENLSKCDDLFYFQLNRFDFEQSLIWNGTFYPMPKKARDLILPGHSTFEKIKVFNYESYINGLKDGYSEMMPKDSNGVIERITISECTLKYRESDKVCEPGMSYEFGVEVGMLYHAWIYIADNIDEFIKVWDVLRMEFENENKTFADRLNVEDKENYLLKLHSLIDGVKGKRIAHVLMYLFDNGIIDVIFRNKIYDLMRNEFTFKTSDESINKYLKYNNEKKDEKEYILVETALKS